MEWPLVDVRDHLRPWRTDNRRTLAVLRGHTVRPVARACAKPGDIGRAACAFSGRDFSRRRYARAPGAGLQPRIRARDHAEPHRLPDRSRVPRNDNRDDFTHLGAAHAGHAHARAHRSIRSHRRTSAALAPHTRVSPRNARAKIATTTPPVV